jgi:hypothetical protein
MKLESLIHIKTNVPLPFTYKMSNRVVKVLTENLLLEFFVHGEAVGEILVPQDTLYLGTGLLQEKY